MPNQANALFSNFLRKKRMKITRPYLRGRILDFGCGVGELTQMCNPETYVGVDIDTTSIEIARKKHPMFQFLFELPENEKFDTIVMLAIIEHIPDPVALLKKLKTMLKPDGYIVLTTPHPAFNSIYAFGSKLGVFSKDANEDHELLINLKTMKELANKANLSIAIYKKFLFGANQLFILKSI